MPTESAFLFAGLLFVAAALGYFFAKYGDADEEEGPPNRLSADYLKGLNYLLNEEPDRAVEVFTRMAQFDEDALEMHLALGALFRKRGEVDRAIKIHQNIMARPALSRQQQAQVQMALADDYLSAGLLDRAENLYMEMRNDSEFRWQALERLIRIFELTQEWDQAIKAYQELASLKVSGDETNHIAQYYCELAEQARVECDYPKAREYLGRARAERIGTVRSELIQGDISRDVGDHGAAIEAYSALATRSPELLVDLVGRVAACARAAETPDALSEFLARVLNGSKEATQAVAVAAIVDPALDNPLALNALQTLIVSDPALAGLVDGERLSGLEPAEQRAALDRVRESLRRILGPVHRYRCRDCGYSMLSLQWQCPSCGHWETVWAETNLRLSG